MGHLERRIEEWAKTTFHASFSKNLGHILYVSINLDTHVKTIKCAVGHSGY